MIWLQNTTNRRLGLQGNYGTLTFPDNNVSEECLVISPGHEISLPPSPSDGLMVFNAHIPMPIVAIVLHIILPPLHPWFQRSWSQKKYSSAESRAPPPPTPPPPTTPQTIGHSPCVPALSPNSLTQSQVAPPATPGRPSLGAWWAKRPRHHAPRRPQDQICFPISLEIPSHFSPMFPGFWWD